MGNTDVAKLFFGNILRTKSRSLDAEGLHTGSLHCKALNDTSILVRKR